MIDKLRRASFEAALRAGEVEKLSMAVNVHLHNLQAMGETRQVHEKSLCRVCKACPQ
jgi:hypothetical protein